MNAVAKPAAPARFRIVPLQGVRGVSRAELPREILAGITLAALMIPRNIGYADVAGLPPVVGRYAAIVPMLVFPLLCTSRHLIASPDAPVAALIGTLLVHASRASSSALGRLPGSDDYARIASNPTAQTVPGLLVVRLDAPLFASNAQRARMLIRQRVRAASPTPRVVLWDLENTLSLDIESVDKLAELQRDLAADGVQLWLGCVHARAAAMLERSGQAQQIGAEHIVRRVGAGVAAFEAQYAG